MDLAIFKKSVIYGSSLIVGMQVLRTFLKLGNIILEPRGSVCFGLILFTNGTFRDRDRESFPLSHRRLGAAI